MIRKATHELIVAAKDAELERLRARVHELEDRLDARSLSEFKTWDGVAMPALEPAEPETPQVNLLWGFGSFDAPPVPGE